jgi:hypothetical protein
MIPMFSLSLAELGAPAGRAASKCQSPSDSALAKKCAAIHNINRQFVVKEASFVQQPAPPPEGDEITTSTAPLIYSKS